ncbi:hypothetical protein ABE244_25680 [Bacillus toyonensis]
MRDKIMELIIELNKLPNPVVSKPHVIDRLLDILKESEKKENDK